MALDKENLRFTEDARARLLELEHETDLARVEFHHGVRRLHAAGGSLREIAEHFGLSHQRVHQIVDTAHQTGRKGKSTMLLQRIKEGGRPTGPWSRFTKKARGVVVRARQEAAELGHGYIGTEHLLLGVLRGRDDAAVDALAKLRVDRQQVRDAIVQAVGQGEAMPDDRRLRFSARAKKVLELARGEAVALDHEYIGTEHILLGLVAEPSGLAARVLSGLGGDPARVRAEVKRALDRRAA